MTIFYLDASTPIKLRVPSEWVEGLLGRQNQRTIVSAASLGVPADARTLTALHVISGVSNNPPQQHATCCKDFCPKSPPHP